MSSAPVLSVSDFVAVLNQTLEFSYPLVTVVGEITNFRVSKNRWVYFDLKDELASVRCFGTVYILPGPLEDGLTVQVSATPRLHPLYNFSLNLQSIQPVGEGSIKKAAALLEKKLAAEGLFDPARKRALAYPPRRLGLITSSESAAYADFVKILGQRWGGLAIDLADVQVQGEQAAGQIVAALEHFNQQAQPPEVLVITRGGGSAEDLAAFNNEALVRAVAASRIPTLVAIGHEVDISLAEMAADQRASTPSNAAELLTPDKKHEQLRLRDSRLQLNQGLQANLGHKQQQLRHQTTELGTVIKHLLATYHQLLATKADLLQALSPQAALKRGYTIIKSKEGIIRSIKQLRVNDQVQLILKDGNAKASITSIKKS